MTSTETRALTWNQRRALRNMLRAGAQTSITPREIADPSWRQLPYLCGSAARSALMALVRKELAVVASGGTPIRYRLTQAGIDAALSEEEG